MSTIMASLLPVHVHSGTDPMHSDHVEQQVLAEQIRHIYRQTPTFVPVVLFGALATIIMLWPVTSPVIAISWCLWIWTLYVTYYLLYRRWCKADPDDKSTPAWAKP